MNDESYVGKECFYIDRFTNDKTYSNMELGECLSESIDKNTNKIICWFDKPFLGSIFLDKRYVTLDENPIFTKKENYIKLWIQAFGERSNYSFFIDSLEVGDIVYDMTLQYSYDEEGNEMEAFLSYSDSEKLIAKYFSSKDEEKMDQIILKLKSIKEFYD